MPIFGAIWYQGESNAGHYAVYGCAIREMVNDWRATWFEGTGGQTNAVFPFGQCQVIRLASVQMNFKESVIKLYCA